MYRSSSTYRNVGTYPGEANVLATPSRVLSVSARNVQVSRAVPATAGVQRAQVNETRVDRIEYL